jgi:hypothetical protein
MAFD